ncbi:MAG: tetratricopeptide repeat protein [Planctomycetota bacterium]|jgi:TolA-binding protein
MTEDRIESLLRMADQSAGAAPSAPAGLAGAVRRRARRRQIRNIITPVAAAAGIVIGVGLWSLLTTLAERTAERQRITSLEIQLAQLQVRADATLKLIQDVLEKERQQRKFAELQAELASIPDPLEEAQEQIEKTAFILVYQADRMYQDRNQQGSAVQTYNRVIERFPQTRSAQTARQRLSEIQTNLINKNGSEI